MYFKISINNLAKFQFLSLLQAGKKWMPRWSLDCWWFQNRKDRSWGSCPRRDKETDWKSRKVWERVIFQYRRFADWIFECLFFEETCHWHWYRRWARKMPCSWSCRNLVIRKWRNQIRKILFKYLRQWWTWKGSGSIHQGRRFWIIWMASWIN